ncbi:MAG TPA: CBS domain-containing protein, partial [Bacteroidales bacterium]
TLPIAALAGMAAMFAGASRALLTSIIFAVETTGQTNVLLPLLAACSTSYIVSFFLLENTIMTEKIARRGVKTPNSYEPDILERITIEQVIKHGSVALSPENTIREIREWTKENKQTGSNYFLVLTKEGEFKGIISQIDLFSKFHNSEDRIGTLIKRNFIPVSGDQSLRIAVEIMANENLDVLPVAKNGDKREIIGILTYKDILTAYSYKFNEHEKTGASISLKRQGLKILLHGQKLLTSVNWKRPNDKSLSFR